MNPFLAPVFIKRKRVMNQQGDECVKKRIESVMILLPRIEMNHNNDASCGSSDQYPIS